MAESIIVDPELEGKAPAAAPATTEEPKQDDIPEKYRGKSLADIIEMHKNAESELGRKNNEIGLVRKLADELIGVRALELKARDNQQEAPKPLTADRLLDNPEEAITSVVKREAHQRTENLERTVKTLEADLMVERFEKKHPGFTQTMNSPEFGEFVKGSNFRRKLAIAAAEGDFDAADELFSMYEEVAKAPTDQGKQQSQGADVEAARKASLAKSGGSSASGVVPSGNGKKVWSRSELIEMRIKRPEEFDMRQEEILEAYREKRVR